MQEVGRALGSRYQLHRRLGEGAMGEVWLARDLRTGEERAAKLLRSSLASDRDLVGRFIQERSILMGLAHPNIVRVHDMVVEGEDLAIVMDLVPGGDLRSRLHEHGTLPARQAVELTCAVLDALAAAHAQGCLHRDVKPDNVLLARPGILHPADVRLTDFGIARLAQEGTVQATGLIGTPGYMPPELFTDGRFSAASDLYAVGVMLYELLGGRTPFSGPGTALTVANRHVNAAPPPLPIPPPLWRLVATMLAKDPTLRHGVTTTATLLRELPAAVLDVPAIAPQAPPQQWQAATADPEESARHRIEVADPGEDVGATFVPGRRAAAPTDARGLGALAEPGSPQALLPTDGHRTGAEAETRIGRPAPSYDVPLLEPKAAPLPERRRRPWLWVVGGLGAAAAVALVVGLLTLTGVIGGEDDEVATTSGGSGEGGEGSSAIAASLDGGTGDSGLRLRHEATYDAETGLVDLSITAEAQGFGLRGPFLQVLPIPDGSQVTECPTAAFTSGEAAPVPRGTRGVAVACAWQLDGVVARNGTTTWVAQVPLELDGEDPEQQSSALDSWLEQVESQTADAIARIGSGTDFAAQRLTGVRVEVNGPVALGDQLQLAVYPEWVGGAGLTEPVFVSNTPASASRGQIIAQVTDDDPSGFTISGCDALQQQGDRFEARRAGPCSITVTLGVLPRAEYAFTVNGLVN